MCFDLTRRNRVLTARRFRFAGVSVPHFPVWMSGRLLDVCLVLGGCLSDSTDVRRTMCISIASVDFVRCIFTDVCCLSFGVSRTVYARPIRSISGLSGRSGELVASYDTRNVPLIQWDPFQCMFCPDRDDTWKINRRAPRGGTVNPYSSVFSSEQTEQMLRTPVRRVDRSGNGASRDTSSDPEVPRYGGPGGGPPAGRSGAPRPSENSTEIHNDNALNCAQVQTPAVYGKGYRCVEGSRRQTETTFCKTYFCEVTEKSEE